MLTVAIRNNQVAVYHPLSIVHHGKTLIFNHARFNIAKPTILAILSPFKVLLDQNEVSLEDYATKIINTNKSQRARFIAEQVADFGENYLSFFD
jgi:hypothetical protein